jgi:hypothetical protein
VVLVAICVGAAIAIWQQAQQTNGMAPTEIGVSTTTLKGDGQ